METRNRLRYSVACPVMFASDRTIAEGLLINLSPPGCAMQTAYPAKHGEYLKLRILLPGLSAGIAIEVAKVQWRRHGQVGVEFLRVRENERQRLQRFLARSFLNAALGA
jgi:PilZ domain